MNREPVESSNLVSVGYDGNMATLEIEFKGNSVYQYFDVSRDGTPRIDAGKFQGGVFPRQHSRQLSLCEALTGGGW